MGARGPSSPSRLTWVTVPAASQEQSRQTQPSCLTLNLSRSRKSATRRHTLNIPVEMEDPFTRMSQNFFPYLSHTAERLCDCHHTSSFLLFFSPFSTTLVCVCSTVLLEFPNHPQEFPNLHTPMTLNHMTTPIMP